MALSTPTTLASACAAADQFIKVTSATGSAVGQIWHVDGEYMIQTALPQTGTSTTIPVSRRGLYGGVSGVAHAILAPVVNGLPGDFPNPQPGAPNNPAIWIPPVISYGVSDAIVLPPYPCVVFIDKATAAAMTLADANAGVPDGTEYLIFSTTAAAHTVTYTAGFYGDTTSSDVATFAAKAGASMTIVKYKTAYGVKALANVTLA